LTECFKGAWRDTGRTLLKMPVLIFVIFALMLATECIRDRLQIASQPALDAGAMSPGKSVLVLFSFGMFILTMVVSSILSVRVIRYSLFGDTPRSRDGALGRYMTLLLIAFGGILVFVLALVFATAVLIHAMKSGGATRDLKYGVLITYGVVYLLALCLIIFVWTRLSLLFPHTAAGGKIRWRSAWQDTRGHFWVMIATFGLTTLPIMIVSVVLAYVRLYALRQLDVSGLTYDISTFLSTAATVLSMVTAATCSAWVYRRFAAELQQPAV